MKNKGHLVMFAFMAALVVVALFTVDTYPIVYELARKGAFLGVLGWSVYGIIKIVKGR